MVRRASGHGRAANGPTPAADRTPALLDALRAGAVEPARAAFGALLRDPGATAALQALLAATVRPWGGAPLDGPGAAATARADGCEADLLLARMADGVGATAAAVTLARDARRGAPGAPGPLFLLCALLLAQGNPEAQALVQRCLSEHPAPAAGWGELGLRLVARGQREAALLCLSRAAHTPVTALEGGRLARDLGRPAEAARLLDEAIRLDPASVRAWFLRGLCAQDSRDVAGAAAAYRAVLALDAGRAEAAVNLGTVLQEGGDLEGARAAYGMAVRARGDSFGRVAQALTMAPRGELWLDLGALRRSLGG